MKVILPDNSERVFEGANAMDLAKSIGKKLAKAAVAAEVNGEIVQLTQPLAEGDRVRILTFDDEEGKEVVRHTASHVMAQAVLHVLRDKNVKFAIGPAIKNGFYYDFDLDSSITTEDFPAIEKEMKKIVEANYPIVRSTMPREKALAWAEEQKQPYNDDLIRDMPEDAERQGLGTPATRAAMIEKLLSAGFVERKGKSLVPTKDGINLAVILPDMLKSPLLTAEWESRLTEIAKGSDDPQSFMQGIEDMTRELVKQYSHITEDGKKLFAPEKEAVGICSRCKSPVYEGKKNFYCSDRSCRFVMWKNDKFFESRRTVFSKKIAAALLKDGKAKVKGLYSERTGKTYDGTVLLCDTGEKYVNYRIEQRK